MVPKRLCPSVKKARIVAGMSDATELSGPPALAPARTPGSVWDNTGRARNKRHRGTTAFVQNFTTDLLDSWTSYSHSGNVDDESIQRVATAFTARAGRAVLFAVCDEHRRSRYELTELRDGARSAASGRHDRRQEVDLPFRNDARNIVSWRCREEDFSTSCGW